MEALYHYKPQTKEEKHYQRLMLELYKTKGEKAFSRDNTDAHFTASAWVIHPRSAQILLIHHKKLNKWLQPGGHADGEQNLEAVARKEVSEEANLYRLQLVSADIFDIDIHLIPERKGIPQHYHYDLRFAYFCEKPEQTRINSESNAFQWIDLEHINTLTKEPSILRMVQKTKSIFNEK